MIPDKVHDILINLLPMIVLFSVVMIVIRIVIIKYTKEKIIVYKELKNLCFIIYLFALFKLVTTTDFQSFSNNFIPFKEIMRYKTTSVLFYRNIIGNILLFLPFGYLITDYVYEQAKKCNLFITLLLTFLTSLTIETIQMFIGRSFDIDDIILNIIGGTLGYITYKIFHKIIKYIPEKYKTNLLKGLFFFLIITLFFLLLIVLYEVKR